jgi:hypothetical protein
MKTGKKAESVFECSNGIAGIKIAIFGEFL